MKLKIEKSENTILEDILKNKINHKHSCLNGICGACRCKKPISGNFKYLDIPIAPIEDDEFTPCIAVVDGDYLVLEL